MRVSIIGSRGIPAKYGGFEVFTEHLSTRLVEKGYSIIVSCEYPDGEKMDEYRGVSLYYFPFPPPKSYLLRKFYEIFNDIYFMAKLGKLCDVMYILGAGAGLFMFIPKLLNKKIKVLVNIDGLEWKRDKFTKLEKMLLKLNIWLATVFADVVVLDARRMGNYVKESCRWKTVFIPYGVEPPEEVGWDRSKLKVLSSRCSKITEVNQNDYWLVVARLEPENNIHTILEGFLKSNSKRPLVVVGDYTSERYRRRIGRILERDKEGRILMVGAIYNDRRLLDMLRQNCFAYIHGHSVGGTNPSLLEAMSMKNIIVAHDNEFNREVGGNTCLYFRTSDNLAEIMDMIEEDTSRFEKLKYLAYSRVRSSYSWEYVVGKYVNTLTNIRDDRT